MAAGGAVIGALRAVLGLDTAQFEEGTKRAKKETGSLKSAIGSAMPAIGAAVVAGAAIAGAALINFGSKALQSADDIGDAAARIGISAEAFQKLQAAAVSAGGSPELMTAALDKLNVGLGAFIATGKGPAASAFADLGIASQITSGQIKTADQAFYAASTALEGIKSPAEKARLSMQLFGKAAGVDMLEVTAVGGAALKGFGDQAAASGRVMSDEMITKLADAKLQMDVFKTGASQMATVLAGQAVVAIIDFAKANAPLIEQGKKLATQFVDIAGKVINFLAPSFRELFSAVGDLMSGPFGQAMLPIVKAIATVVGGALVIGLRLAANALTLMARSINGLFTVMNPLLVKFREFGTNLIDGLVNGLRAGYERARAAVGELVSNMKSAFTNPLQIRSPSGVFIDYGQNIAEGLAIGIRNKTGVAVDAMKALADAASSLFEKYSTSEESATRVFIAESGQLDAALKSNIINMASYLALKSRIDAGYGEAIKKTLPEGAPLDIKTGPDVTMPALRESARIGLGEAANDNSALRDGFARTFADAIRLASEGGNVWDMLKNKLRDALGNALDGLLNNLGKGIFDIFASMGKGGGAGGGGGFLAMAAKAAMSVFTKGQTTVPGFKTGGSFTVGGSGGADSQLMAFRATPGELVDIRKPGNDNRGGGDTYVTVQSMLDGQILDQRTTRIAGGVSGGMFGAAVKSQQRQSTFRKAG